MSYIVSVDQREFKVNVTRTADGFTVFLNGEEHDVQIASDDSRQLTLIVDRKPFVVVKESEDHILVNGETYSVSVIGEQIQRLIKARPDKFAKKELTIKAVMPGLVIDVIAEEGASVNVGDALLVVEAMKMQNEVKTPQAGTVKKILVQKGKTVNSGDALVVIE